MDLAGRLLGVLAAPDRPGPRLLLARGEEGDQVERGVGGQADLIERRPLDAEIVEERLAVVADPARRSRPPAWRSTRSSRCPARRRTPAAARRSRRCLTRRRWRRTAPAWRSAGRASRAASRRTPAPAGPARAPRPAAPAAPARPPPPCRRTWPSWHVRWSRRSTTAWSANISSSSTVSASSTGSTRPSGCGNLIVLEAAHDQQHGVGGAHVGEQLVAEPLAALRPPHELGQIGHLERRRHHLAGVRDARQLGQAGIAHVGHALSRVGRNRAAAQAAKRGGDSRPGQPEQPEHRHRLGDRQRDAARDRAQRHTGGDVARMVGADVQPRQAHRPAPARPTAAPAAAGPG